jgi:uncharacterized protein YjbI with pentapeptide repeats
MRIVVPPNVSFGYCVGSLNPPHLTGVFIVKATLRLRPDQIAEWDDQPSSVSGDLYVDDDLTKALRYPSDFAVFKSRADVLVVGHAHSPGGRPVEMLRVGFSVGRFAKLLAVTGDRLDGGALGGLRFQPFTTMSLGYELAYGGNGFARNPIGRGHDDDDRAPNLYEPTHNGVPEPAGFGPIPPHWPQRRDLLGSYGGDYVRERWPWFPRDFDWGYFNAAPRDQQLDGYLVGDETLSLEHLHPQYPMLRSKLPGVRVRCFIKEEPRHSDLPLREVPMSLDTLWVDGDASRLVLVWRGNARVRTPKMREIVNVVVGTEPLSEHARPASAYETILEQTLRPKTMVRRASSIDATSSAATIEAEVAASNAQLAELERKAIAAETELQTLAARYLRERPNRAGSSARTGESDSRFETLQREMHAAEEELQALQRDMSALEMEFAGSRWTRERVAAAVAVKAPLNDLDLADLNLSDLNLTGIDFSGSRLMRSNLRNANLAGARLTNVDLTAATLEGADLGGVNLDGADLTGAIVTDTKLTNVSINRATLAGLNLSGADLSGSAGLKPNFSGATLTGARMIRVKMPGADFSGCNLEEAVLTGADLPAAQFHAVRARAIDLSAANLQRIQADESADFSHAEFGGADAAGAIFDMSNLDFVDFRSATLVGAQFEGTSLRGANFDRANLTDAMLDSANLQNANLTNANLLRASLEGADATDARLNGANMFEAGFWLTVFVRTELAGANFKRTLLSL